MRLVPMHTNSSCNTQYYRDCMTRGARSSLQRGTHVLHTFGTMSVTHKHIMEPVILGPLPMHQKDTIPDT